MENKVALITIFPYQHKIHETPKSLFWLSKILFQAGWESVPFY